MQYWKQRPDAPFTAFAEVTDDEKVIKYPVETYVVMGLEPQTQLNDLLVKPPKGFVPVFRFFPVPINDNPLMRVTNNHPMKTTDGYWSEYYTIEPLSIEETDILLADTRAQKNAEINASRLAANNHFFPFMGKEIACDPLSRSDIDGVNGIVNLYGALPQPWVGGWKCRDNTYIPITTVDDWKNLYRAMFEQGQINFAHSQTLKAMLTSAATLDEIKAVSWQTDTGLPKTPLPA